MIYWILILFYVALIIQEVMQKNYWKVVYFVGAVLITVALMRMEG